MFKVWVGKDAFSNAVVEKLAIATGEEIDVILVNYLNLVDYITQTGGGELPLVYKDGERIGGYDDTIIYLYNQIAPVEPVEAPTEPSEGEVVLPPIEEENPLSEPLNG